MSKRVLAASSRKKMDKSGDAPTVHQQPVAYDQFAFYGRNFDEIASGSLIADCLLV